MNFHNKELGLSLEIEDKLLGYLQEEGKKHYPKEFGGFLVGFYSSDLKKLYITDTILPIKYKSSNYFFERDTTGVSKILTQLYNGKPSKYYVGEWHTHPRSAATPSITDIKAMHDIAKYHKVQIEKPVMLIIGEKNNKTDLGFYILFNKTLHRYEQTN